ncbi:GlsB/YeaQ/YmgE family stress response membrane protein [Thalassobacillus devorans]|uniref:GlsB/YeaQ/YmgE family stress response membrane protein n=1 Tax=Thalassobacillus devorans TaxID=279813 RepID=UPI00048DB0C8|nr:GlsB/YeaQ/YmgE family stress response membrane protein [Thalassobacillus devorans]
MGIILYLIVGGLIGWLAGAIIGRDMPLGIIGNIIAGIVGAWIGGELLGSWGPSLAGIAIVPALIGAIIFVFIISAIMRGSRKKR